MRTFIKKDNREGMAEKSETSKVIAQMQVLGARHQKTQNPKNAN